MTSEREELCDLWRDKLSAALESYRRARDFRQAIQDEMPHLPQSDGGLAFRQAVHAEMVAQINHRETLRVFTDLAVHGIRPEENIR